MCGRYTLTIDDRLFREHFNISIEDLGFDPNYNIHPGAEVPVVFMDSGAGNISVRLMRWGLIPKWSKTASTGYKMINARAETVHEKPSYKVPFERQRCIVTADGFYEWKKQGEFKIPYRITLPEEKPFAFAGLWDRWCSPEGIETCSFTIVTVDANTAVRDIHDRMPALLVDQESREMWLNQGTSAEDLKRLLCPYDGQVVSYKVSPLINSPGNNFRGLISESSSCDDLE